MELEVKKLDIPLASLTLVGENLVNYTGLLAKTSKLLSDRNINILAVTVAVNSMSYFIEEAVEEEALRVLHNFVLHDKKLLSVTSQKGLGMVYIASPAFVSEPGVLGKFTTAIGEARVNIIEVTTSKSQIIAFVNYKDLEVAYEIAKLVFKKEEK
jgi:aspartokinase